MHDHHGPDIELSLDAVPLAQLRAEVRRLSGPHAQVGIEDAVQVTDELASNACRHGAAPRICRLTMLEHASRLLIEIDDSSPSEPHARVADRTGGLGMTLIDHLASRWGVSHGDGRKTVWAEVELKSAVVGAVNV
jgi:two-component sensor histidine kinase